QVHLQSIGVGPMRKLVLSLVLFATVFTAAVLSAQTYEGRIVGLVTDVSGAVVPGARVTITNTANGISRTVITTNSGEYSAPNLQPAPYVVTFEAKGFQTFRRTGLRVEVARDVRVDAALRPGSVSTTVTVSGQAPVINTTNDVLGSTFSNEAVNELPLQGRDF